MCRWNITGNEYIMRNLVAFALLAVGLAFAMAGCQKEGCTDSKASNYDPYAKKDNGTCVYTTPQPDPTDTIVIPTKEKTFDVDWNVDGATTYYVAPPADSIKKYTSDPEYKYVFINFMNKNPNPNIEQEGMPCSGYQVRTFKRARDTLQTRIDIDPKKVRGSGTIIVAGPGELGIHRSDSTWYADNGWRIFCRNLGR